MGSGQDGWRQGQFVLYNDTIEQQLRAGQGVRFKVLGDGAEGWRLLLPTTATNSSHTHFQSYFTTRPGSVVEVDIPYSDLRQPDWAMNDRNLRVLTFNKDTIDRLIIQRHAEAHEPNISGRSVIKIFDFEIYGATTPPAAAPTAVENPYISGAEWTAFSDEEGSTSTARTGIETINGQQRDVLTITINLVTGNPRWAGGAMNDSSKLLHLRNSSGVRFKVLGDGNSWGFLVYINSVNDDAYHRYNFSTKNGEFVDINIPFSRLTQPDWGRRVPFRANDARGFGIQRDDFSTRSVPATSSVKIYDLEFY